MAFDLSRSLEARREQMCAAEPFGYIAIARIIEIMFTLKTSKNVYKVYYALRVCVCVIPTEVQTPVISIDLREIQSNTAQPHNTSKT